MSEQTTRLDPDSLAWVRSYNKLQKLGRRLATKHFGPHTERCHAEIHAEMNALRLRLGFGPLASHAPERAYEQS